MSAKLKSCSLTDLVTIRTGQSFRSSLKEDPHGSIFAIRSKDLLQDGSLSGDLMTVSCETQKIRPNVSEGDVLVLARGVRFNAAAVLSLPGPTVAQNMFHILKIKGRSRILPEFLAAYLNQPFTQDRIKAKAAGVSVANLKADDLAQLVIPLPPLQLQRLFVTIFAAAAEEQQLLHRLADLRQQQLAAAFSTLS